MIIGYARVSTHEQNLDLQKDALIKAGCEKIITDETNGKLLSRPGLNQLKEILRVGDTLIVWRLDRLSRSLKQLIEWINYLERLEICFKSLHETIDTSSSSGKLIFHVFGALAEFEYNLIKERTLAGIIAARARGKFGGRPKKLNESKIKLMKQLYKNEENSVSEICKIMGISRPTLYRYLKIKESENFVKKDTIGARS